MSTSGAQIAPAGTAADRLQLLHRAADALCRRRDRDILLPLAVAILLFGVGGVVTQSLGGVGFGPKRLFNLDEEVNAPAAFSTGLLLVAGGLALVAASGRATPGPRGRVAIGRRSALAFSALFVLMAVDEGAQAHESLERLTGVDWQILYAPVMLGAAVVWLIVVRQLSGERRARSLLIGGAAAWGLAQTFEALQWNGDEVIAWMIIPEEMLEMVGSTLFILSFVSLLRMRAGLAAPV